MFPHSSSLLLPLKGSSSSQNILSNNILNRNAYNILNLNLNTNKNNRKKNFQRNKSKEEINIKNPKYYNISMLSKQKQLQLNKNKILLINLTSCVTELARILILAGFNIYLYDKEIINENDINNNLLLNENDIGKIRMEAIYNYLMPLSATVSITKIYDYTIVKDYRIAIVGFNDFISLIEYEEYFNRKDILFFSLNSSGLYAFFYHNLNDKNCKKFIESEKENEKNILLKGKKKDDYGESKNDDYLFNKKNMIAPSNFLKKSEKFFETGKKYEKDYLVFAIFLLEIYYKKNIDKKNIKNVIKKEINGNNNFVKKMFFIENYLKQKEFYDIINNQELMDTIKKFVVNFNREFNPICSIIAKKLFSTLFIFFKYNIIPKKTFITYNSDITEYNSETFLQ